MRIWRSQCAHGVCNNFPARFATIAGMMWRSYESSNDYAIEIMTLQLLSSFIYVLLTLHSPSPLNAVSLVFKGKRSLANGRYTRG